MRAGLIVLWSLVLLGVASGACGVAEQPPEEALAGLRDAVFALPDSGLRGPPVRSVELGEARRIDYGGEGPTWCVVVESVTDDPSHWLEGNSLWIVFEEEGGWRALPTLIIATGGSWPAKCEMPEFEPGRPG